MAEPATDEGEWYTVRFTLPKLVRDIYPREDDTHQDAINIAIAEIGKQIEETPVGRQNISVQMIECPAPDCDHEMQAVMANAGLVMVNLTMDVNVEAESADHASNRATREIGQRLEDTPLQVLNVTRLNEPPADG